jgi:hypothetical protein
MPLGTCKLCLAQGVDLQKSHLIPAGAYKAIRNSSGEPPIVMKSAITIKKDELCTYRSPEKFITKGGMKPGTLITAFGKLMAKTRVVGKLGSET